MADKVESAAPPVVATPKKAAAPKVKKPKAKSSHPPTASMVNSAIKELKERNGSSLQAIKKYVAGTYKLDAEKLAPFIKKYLKSAVANGTLVQPKGKGATGSFKLAVKDKKTKVAKPAASKVTKKPASSKKPAAPKVKKVAAEKKKATKVAAKPPKAKTASSKPKVTKAAPKKIAKATSPSKKVSAPKTKKPAAKKVAKK